MINFKMQFKQSDKNCHSYCLHKLDMTGDKEIDGLPSICMDSSITSIVELGFTVPSCAVMTPFSHLLTPSIYLEPC